MMQPDKGILFYRNSDTANHVCAVVIILCMPLLFFGDPARFHLRLLPYIWDLGHIALFAAISWLIISKWDRLSEVSDYKILPITLIVVVSVSIPIEWLQGVYDRENSLLDVMRNFIGASTAIAFRSNGFDERRSIVRVILQILVSCLLFISAYPLVTNSIDSINSYRSFPVLSDFESPLQLNRWNGNQLRINQPESDSNHVMEALFTTEKYSSVNLEEFPGNWVGFSHLRFKIFNPNTITYSIYLAISDLYHANNNWDYHDRFNQIIYLEPGWNDIVVDLEKVRLQPKKRNIDMSKIDKIAFITNRLKVDMKFYFDDFVLEN